MNLQYFGMLLDEMKYPEKRKKKPKHVAMMEFPTMKSGTRVTTKDKKELASVNASHSTRTKKLNASGSLARGIGPFAPTNQYAPMEYKIANNNKNGRNTHTLAMT